MSIAVTRNPRGRGSLLLIGSLLLAIVLVIVGIGLLGGWDTVPGSRTRARTIQPGETVAARPFRITPVEARWTTDPGFPYLTPEGSRLILAVLEVEVVNDFPVPSYTLASNLGCDAPGIPVLGSDPASGRQQIFGFQRVIDHHTPKMLSPGLPQRIAFLWQQPLTHPLPAEISVTLPSFTWRRHSGGLGHDWFDPTPVARVTLPLSELEP